MTQLALPGARELTVAEAERIEGGYTPIVGFLASCFAAGFEFGFNTLGPMICGDSPH